MEIRLVLALSVGWGPQDERSGQSVTIGLWPCSAESDLERLLARAAFESRGFGGPSPGGPDDWLL
jgi:hypothetical protein